MKTLYSFINAILFHKNRLRSDCRKQEPPGSISFLLYNLLIMTVTGTNSVSFAKKQAYFLKENRDSTCHFSGKQLAFLTFETRLSKKILFWSKTLKIRACSRVKRQKSGPALDFWKSKIDPGRWHTPVYPTLGSSASLSLPPPSRAQL